MIALNQKTREGLVFIGLGIAMIACHLVASQHNPQPSVDDTDYDALTREFTIQAAIEQVEQQVEQHVDSSPAAEQAEQTLFKVDWDNVSADVETDIQSHKDGVQSEIRSKEVGEMAFYALYAAFLVIGGVKVGAGLLSDSRRQTKPTPNV
jgi:hypothetical protein